MSIRQRIAFKQKLILHPRTPPPKTEVFIFDENALKRKISLTCYTIETTPPLLPNKRQIWIVSNFIAKNRGGENNTWEHFLSWISRRYCKICTRKCYENPVFEWKNGVVILCVKEMLVGEYKLVLSTKLGGSTTLGFLCWFFCEYIYWLLFLIFCLILNWRNHDAHVQVNCFIISIFEHWT